MRAISVCVLLLEGVEKDKGAGDVRVVDNFGL